LVRNSGLAPIRIRQQLRAMIDAGKVDVGTKWTERIDGRVTRVGAYRFRH
jgi:hypothetical protein